MRFFHTHSGYYGWQWAEIKEAWIGTAAHRSYTHHGICMSKEIRKEFVFTYRIRLCFHNACFSADDFCPAWFESGPPGFKCWTSVAPASCLAVEYSSCFVSVMNLYLYVHCFDSLMSRCPSHGPNNFVCVYEPQQNPWRGWALVKP